MESQPQNPEFRNNPENFHPWVIEENCGWYRSIHNPLYIYVKDFWFIF